MSSQITERQWTLPQIEDNHAMKEAVRGRALIKATSFLRRLCVYFSRMFPYSNTQHVDALIISCRIFCKGPALYAYNNAVFTDEDWERIQKAGRSGKLKDPNKIGRFGIGFNSVYHITGETLCSCHTNV